MIRDRPIRQRQPWHGRTRITRQGAGGYSESSQEGTTASDVARPTLLLSWDRAPDSAADAHQGGSCREPGGATLSAGRGFPLVPGTTDRAGSLGPTRCRETPGSIRSRRQQVVAGGPGRLGEAGPGSRAGSRRMMRHRREQERIRVTHLATPIGPRAGGRRQAGISPSSRCPRDSLSAVEPHGRWGGRGQGGGKGGEVLTRAQGQARPAAEPAYMGWQDWSRTPAA